MDNRYFNKSIINFVRKITLILIGIVFLNTNAQAQPTRTGTNLNSKAMPSTILMLQAPDEVETMRQLLTLGKKNDALIAAENYLDKIKRTTLPHQSKKKYYAWNAYCTVLTSLGRVEEAVAACSIAMEFESEKWSAINNRGTAYFVGHKWLEAMLDYQAALTLVGDDNNSVRETIQHNILLTEQRQ
jgi:tetratricopeptide (TPR) repeat protein